MAERETIAERKAREQAAREAEQAARAAAEVLGGMSGKAAEELTVRKSKLDKAIEEAGG